VKATEAGLLAFLKKSPQFVIPIYQRTYSWTDKEWSSALERHSTYWSNSAISVHFIGSIVYIEAGLSQVSHRSPPLVIDGQQRLTTVTLFSLTRQSRQTVIPACTNGAGWILPLRPRSSRTPGGTVCLRRTSWQKPASALRTIDRRSDTSVLPRCSLIVQSFRRMSAAPRALE
jgi:hypothetical protein